MGGFVKGMRKIVIRVDNGETREYLIPRSSTSASTRATV